MTFSKLLAALASTLLLNPLAQVHGAKEFIMPPYDISTTSNQGDVIEITLKSFLASDEANLGTRFQCQNGSSDEHYVGTTVSKQQTMNILVRNDIIVVGSIVDEVDGNVYQFSTNESGDLQGTVRHTSDFPEEIDPVEDDVNIPSRHLRDIYSSRHTLDFPEEIDPVEDPVEDDVNISSRHLRDIYSSNERVLETKCPLHVVHVLSPWTAEAECLESGLESDCDRTESTARKITDLIKLAIAETNSAYKASGVKVNGMFAELKLAHAYYESTIEESRGYGGILSQTRDSSVIAAQRTKYGADVVASITSLSNFCGIAKIGPNIYNMFSVTGRTCATGYFSFGHEIGHNMGALHDRGTSSDCSSTGYHFGYRDPDAGFRSILAYSCTKGQCDNNKGGGSCTRVQRFSNDEFLYNGKAIGNSRADNARQHSDVFAAVSAYYECKDSSTNTPTTSGQTKTPTSQPLPTSSPISTTDAPTIFKRCTDNKILANERQGRSSWSSAGFSFIFKLEAFRDIIIDTIFLDFRGTATVSLWTKKGSYEGYEKDETKWANIVNGVAMGTGEINKEDFTPVKIDKGTDQSFYLYVTNQSIFYKKGKSKGAVDAENNDLKMIWGVFGQDKWNSVRSWNDERMVHTKIHYKECKSEETNSPTSPSTCVDDQNFTKGRGGRERTCEYIGKGNKQWRLNKWCNKNKNGSPISEACCETCKKCTCGAGCGKVPCLE